jgi:branched-chain amino acid transport system permease protein
MFLLGVLTLTVIFAAAGLPAAWLQRRLGLLSIAHMAVIGTGAYGYARVAAAAGPSVGVLAATVCGCLVGALTTSLSFRSVGEYFALSSFALQIGWYTLVSNTRALTGGMLGLAGVPRPPGSEMIGSAGATLLLLVIFSSLWILASKLFSRSWIDTGFAVIARSGELGRTLGFPERRLRLGGGLFYGSLMGIVGAATAGFVSFVSPPLFDTGGSVTVLALGFLGQRRLIFTAIGSVLIVGLPECLRLTGMGSAETAYLRLALAGIAVFLGSFVLTGKAVRQ